MKKINPVEIAEIKSNNGSIKLPPEKTNLTDSITEVIGLIAIIYRLIGETMLKG